MALSGARDEGQRGALQVVIAAAEATAAAIRAGADNLKDPYDRTAVLNAANFWEFFAQQVRSSDWRLEKPKQKAQAAPQSVDARGRDDGDSSPFDPMSLAHVAFGGEFGSFRLGGSE